MRRATFITWEQLKVGGLILLALAVLTIGMFRLGQAANLFESRYDLVALLPNASGLREGGSVTVAGQLAGIIKRIEFLPVDADTTRNLRITVEVNEGLRAQIREDSKARVRTLGLLGDKVLDVSVGTPRFSELRPGDTLQVEESLDYEQVIAQASGAVGDMVQLTADLRQITGGIVRGEGTMGMLLTDRSLYDRLNGTLSQLNSLLVRLERPNGTFGRLIDDPTLYHNLTSVLAQLDSLTRQMNSRQGTVGRLPADDTLYVRMVGVVAGADSLLKMVSQGNGFAGKMLRDQELYDRLNKAVTDLSAILEDVRRDPRKYTRGMIKVF